MIFCCEVMTGAAVEELSELQRLSEASALACDRAFGMGTGCERTIGTRDNRRIGVSVYRLCKAAC